VLTDNSEDDLFIKNSIATIGAIDIIGKVRLICSGHRFLICMGESDMHRSRPVASTTTDPPLLARKAFRIREVADQFGVSRNTIYSWHENGLLPLTRIGGRLLILAEHLSAFEDQLRGAHQ
jgi:excisionase family DNA binding protein